MFNISSIRKQTEKGNKRRLNKIIRYIKQRIEDRSYHGYNSFAFNGYYICETKDEIEIIANYFISKGFTINDCDCEDWAFDICW